MSIIDSYVVTSWLPIGGNCFMAVFEYLQQCTQRNMESLQSAFTLSSQLTWFIIVGVILVGVVIFIEQWHIIVVHSLEK